MASFKKQSARMAQSSKYHWRIVTDISGFYDRLNLHRLESQLLSIGACKKTVSKINEILFTWSGRNSYGLPVGGNASRILAEASLIDIDNYLLKERVPFIRFVDDFRLFATDLDEAHFLIQTLQQRLAEDGLALNAEKTHILPALLEEANGKPTLQIVQPTIETDAELTDREAQRLAWQIYGGRVPLSYRPMSDEKRENLQQVDVDATLRDISDEPEPDAEIIRDLVRAIFVQQRKREISELFRVMRRYTKITPYTTQMLLSEESTRDRYAGEAASQGLKWLREDREKPDYVVIALVRLIMGLRPDYFAEMFDFLLSLPRDGSSIVGREVLLNVVPHLDRSRLLRARSLYFRSTLAERRALVYAFISNDTVHRKEKSPWLRAIRATNDDIFIDRMIGKFFKESPNIKKKRKNKK
jgi:hypothetical protein